MNFLDVDNSDKSKQEFNHTSDISNIRIAIELDETVLKENLNLNFFKACEIGDNEKIISMFHKKYSLDRKPEINKKYLHDFTVLHISIINKLLETVKILLEYGADIEAETTMKRRPLHLAVITGDFIMSDYLISCGAELNTVDLDFNTPLHYASKMGYIEIVELLVYKNAKLDLRNKLGETPLDIIHNAETLKVIYRIIINYKVFTNYLGLEKTKSLRSNYARQFIGNRILHNNRADNIKIILFKDRKISSNLNDSMNQENKTKYMTEININSFKIIELLGKGSFGEVYLVEHRNNKKKYAMKALNKKDILDHNIISYIFTERKILSNIKHPFIVQLYYALQTEDFLYLIMEYCEGKDLNYHLIHQKQFNEETVRIILCQVLLAVEELHKHGIIYRDLKPENIFLDINGYIKLTDFGLSKEGVYDNTSARSFCGSLAYIAPEMLKKQGHGKSVDWYLFGALMYEMLVGIPPFYTTISKEALFYNISEGKLTFPKNISPNAKDLMKRLLNRNHKKRLGSGILDANEIKCHPFFAEIDLKKIHDKNFEPPKLSSVFKHRSHTVNITNFNKFHINKDILNDLKQNNKSNRNNIKNWSFIDDNIEK